MLINECFTYVGTYAPRVQGCTCVRTCVVVVVVVVRDHFNFYVVSRRRTAPRKTCHPDSGRGQVDVAPDLMHEPAKRQSFCTACALHLQMSLVHCMSALPSKSRVRMLAFKKKKHSRTYVRAYSPRTALAEEPELWLLVQAFTARSHALTHAHRLTVARKAEVVGAAVLQCRECLKRPPE